MLRILLVDDEPLVLIGLQGMLEGEKRMKLEHFGMAEPGDCRLVFTAGACLLYTSRCV